MKQQKLTPQQFWNPLILPAELKQPRFRSHCFNEEDVQIDSKAKSLYATFTEKLTLARTKIKKDIVPLLDFPQGSDPTHGFSCTSSFIPNLFWLDKGKKSDEKYLEDVKYWWPKSCSSSKPMRWVMSVNLGSWYWLLMQMTAMKGQYSTLSPYGVVSSLCDDAFPCWFHFFVDLQSSFDFLPDCAIVPEYIYSFDKSGSMFIPADQPGDVTSMFKQFQDQAGYNDSVSFNPPCDFLGEPVIRFQKDTPNSDGDFNSCEDDPEEYTGKVRVFGRPHSQQTPARYISPNRLSMRGCSPIMNCDDGQHDMTHQFYMDTFAMDPIHFSRHYCKMDSSCT